jgi:hypothetical protein
LCDQRVPIDEDPRYSVVIGGNDSGGRGSVRRLNILYRGTTPIRRSRSIRTVARSLLAELEASTLRERSDAIYLGDVTVRSPSKTALLPSALGPRLESVHRRLERSGVSVVPAAAAAIDPATGLLTPVRSDLDVSRALARLADAFTGDLDEDHAIITDPIPADIVCALTPTDPIHETTRAETLRRMVARVRNIEIIGLQTAIVGLGRLLSRSRCLGMSLETGQRVADVLIPALGFDRQAHD